MIFNERYAADARADFYIGRGATRTRLNVADMYKYLGLRLDADLSWEALRTHLKSQRRSPRWRG